MKLFAWCQFVINRHISICIFNTPIIITSMYLLFAYMHKFSINCSFVINMQMQFLIAIFFFWLLFMYFSAFSFSKCHWSRSFFLTFGPISFIFIYITIIELFLHILNVIFYAIFLKLHYIEVRSTNINSIGSVLVSMSYVYFMIHLQNSIHISKSLSM